MHILKRFAIAVALALPVAATAQPTVQPGIKAVAPKQAPIQAAPPQYLMDDVTQLKMQIARQQQQIAEMRQQLERTSRALEELQRKYTTHTHIVQGSAVPIDQFEGEVRRNFRNTRVSVSEGLLQTSGPRNSN